MSSATKYGLIAGNGDFPFLVLSEAGKAGARLSVVAIREEADERLNKEADEIVWLGIGKLGKMISYFRDRGVTKAMMAGQVKHAQLFSGAIPDLAMVRLLWGLARKNTDSLIGAVADEMARAGIELIDSTYFLQDHLAPDGVLTRRKPGSREKEDILYGLEIAGELARLDLGQTVAVRESACIAVEAMEGTDEVIKRAGRLAGKDVTIIKVAKPEQDMRFDVPVIGLSTIRTMAESGAECISVTANKTLVFDKDAVVALADEKGIVIMGTRTETITGEPA